MKALIYCLAMFTCIAGSGARAADFNFDFEAAGQSVKGILSTVSPADPSLISALSGSFNGNPIALAAPGGLGGNDNLFSYTQMFSGHYLDVNGFDFTSGGLTYNLYYSLNLGAYRINGSASGGSFTASPVTTTAAPEPGAWALMLGGVAILGAALRIRKARRDEDAVKDIATA